MGLQQLIPLVLMVVAVILPAQSVPSSYVVPDPKREARDVTGHYRGENYQDPKHHHALLAAHRPKRDVTGHYRGENYQDPKHHHALLAAHRPKRDVTGHYRGENYQDPKHHHALLAAHRPKRDVTGHYRGENYQDPAHHHALLEHAHQPVDEHAHTSDIEQEEPVNIPAPVAEKAQTTALVPNCACVVPGGCKGREELTRQFDGVSNLTCGQSFERCCFEDPWPGLVDEYASKAPCIPQELCVRWYGQEPTDVHDYGVLGPCPGLGAVRCLPEAPVPEVLQVAPEAPVEIQPEPVVAPPVEEFSVPIIPEAPPAVEETPVVAPAPEVVPIVPEVQTLPPRPPVAYELPTPEVLEEVAPPPPENPPSPLIANCACVLPGGCLGREEFTKQFDSISNLTCGLEYVRCCYEDPWPGPVDEYANQLPCIPQEHCVRWYGQQPTDVRDYGVLGPCPGLGTVRCIPEGHANLQVNPEPAPVQLQPEPVVAPPAEEFSVPIIPEPVVAQTPVVAPAPVVQSAPPPGNYDLPPPPAPTPPVPPPTTYELPDNEPPLPPAPEIELLPPEAEPLLLGG